MSGCDAPTNFMHDLRLASTALSYGSVHNATTISAFVSDRCNRGRASLNRKSIVIASSIPRAPATMSRYVTNQIAEISIAVRVSTVIAMLHRAYCRNAEYDASGDFMFLRDRSVLALPREIIFPDVPMPTNSDYAVADGFLRCDSPPLDAIVACSTDVCETETRCISPLLLPEPQLVSGTDGTLYLSHAGVDCLKRSAEGDFPSLLWDDLIPPRPVKRERRE